MEKLESLSTQEKEQLIHYLGKLYRKGSVHEAFMNQGMVEDHPVQENDMEITALLRLILRQMNREYAMIILNDFFEVKERGWWHSIYSRSSYNRCKKEAVDLLLNRLYTAQ